MHCKVCLRHFGKVIGYLSESDDDFADRRLSRVQGNVGFSQLSELIFIQSYTRPSAIINAPITCNINYHLTYY